MSVYLLISWSLESRGEDVRDAGRRGTLITRQHASPTDWPGNPTKCGFEYYFVYVRHQDGLWRHRRAESRFEMEPAR